ncbi:MAG TPA: 50S ribosomal protein L37ae [Candidatus Nanoarchaeia archaeon]|nr:50S ribosomal protein L37ae [Candidatus Nanoarchaeia archaeon]
MRTKKVGSAGRFGARYGRKTRQKVQKIEAKLRAKHKCPYCSKLKVKRLSIGIWQCKGCQSKLTGRAYSL